MDIARAKDTGTLQYEIYLNDDESEYVVLSAVPRCHTSTVQTYVKRRSWPEVGSIPDVLDMFRCELRFYREIAPEVGVRVPACYRAEETAEGTLLVLEDLSAWQPGADPAAAARVLAGMHRRWEGQARQNWPWLRRHGAAVDLVGELFDRTWPLLAARDDLTPSLRALGARLVAHVADADDAAAGAGVPTLAHGDASMLNMRTGPTGEVALLDWEDVSSAPGICDLAWMLVSSVDPGQWDAAIAAYGQSAGLAEALPAAMVQGLFSLSDTPVWTAEATSWICRIDAAGKRLQILK
jgi:Phosphotransferase enzyme family